MIARHRPLLAGRDLLEIGSGTGAQVRVLREVCKSAVGIDLPEGGHSADRLVEVIDYDGRYLPFPDVSFDVIFSSNVMEHITDPETIHSEMHRVLRPNGACIHVVPSHTWRLWTSLIHYPALAARLIRRSPEVKGTTHGSHLPQPINPKGSSSRWVARLQYALLSPAHGEFGNPFSEYFYFRPSAWRNHFESHGWKVDSREPAGLAYTGNCFLADHLSIRARERWARVLGSSSIVFVLRPA